LGILFDLDQHVGWRHVESPVADCHSLFSARNRADLLCHELVLIGLAASPLGVDIEWLAKTVDIEAVGEFGLSYREREAFRRLDPSDRERLFLQCWTQKEAYLKAIGKGLLVSPASVEVFVGPDEEPGLKSVAGNPRAAARWFLNLVAPRDRYIGAVAILGDRGQVQMTVFDTSCLLVREETWAEGWPGASRCRG
jgi:hypothetical protein